MNGVQIDIYKGWERKKGVQELFNVYGEVREGGGQN